MRLSGEFTNAIGFGLMVMPPLAIAFCSMTTVHPGITAAVTVASAFAYRFRNQLTSIFSEVTKIKPIEATKEMDEVAKAIGLKGTPEIFVAEIPENNAYASSDAVMFTQEAVETQTDEQLLSVFAHECAHIKRGDYLIEQGRVIGFFASSLGCILTAGQVGVDPSGYETMMQQSVTALAYLGSALLPFAVSAGFRSRFASHRKELDCDLRGVMAAGNPAAAMSSLIKMNGDDADMDCRSHPSLNRRLDNLQRSSA